MRSIYFSALAIGLVTGFAIPVTSVAEINFEALARWRQELEQAKQEEQAAKKARAGWFQSTQEECIIENMPGVQNDVVARTVAVECAKLPERDGPYTTSGIFGTKTATRCIVKNGADIKAHMALDYSAMHVTAPIPKSKEATQHGPSN